MKPPIYLLSLAVVAAGLAGCFSPPQTQPPQASTKYTVANTEVFVALDPVTQDSVACTGLQERKLPDGRIQVIANVRNLQRWTVAVLVQCVFKDEQGLPAGGETPWRTLILPEDSTEAVRFTALNALATHYTIRVRAPR